MMELAARTGAGLILMHAGDGADDTGTGEDVLQTVRVFFERALDRAARVGLDPRQICLDPGIGFGKTREGDRRLVSNLKRLTAGLPETALLVGASRKRVVGNASGRRFRFVSGCRGPSRFTVSRSGTVSASCGRMTWLKLSGRLRLWML